MNAKHAEVLLQQLGVLLVDYNPFMRKMVRGLLGTIGVKTPERDEQSGLGPQKAPGARQMGRDAAQTGC